MNKIDKIPLGIYEKAIPLSLDWEEKFKVVGEAGFDFIEFSIDGLKPRIDRLDIADSEYQKIYDLSIKYDMPFRTMALTANRYYPLGDEVLSERGIEIVKRAIEIAAILKIKIIQIATYDVYQKESNDESINRLFNNLVKLADIAKTKDIILAPEVLEDVPFFESVKKASSIIKRLNHDNIKLYADCGNTASIGIDNKEDLKYDSGLIKCLHIKDALIDNCRNVPFGEGLVNFKEVLSHFNENDYEGYFVVEVWSDEDLSFIAKLKDIASFVRKEIKEVEN